MRLVRALVASGLLTLGSLQAVAGDRAAAIATGDFRDRPPQDEVVYFLLPDRFENGDPSNDHGGLEGDRLATGYDPVAKGFYHGGDLKGLLSRLDYIQGLGATAIWLGPIYKNKPVQGLDPAALPSAESAAGVSAGYHGYWITDFTVVDPHFGTDADLRALVDAVHARGMKIYLDVITNHTADVISYRECPTSGCTYRSRADYPESGGRRFAYTPFVPAGEEQVKVPAWLNDPAWYNNRGNSEWWGESAVLGDFAGLDDLRTEHPRVVQGFIDIFGDWIDRYAVDGFRIDTAKHVDDAFWQAFVPAMLERARRRGIPEFYIFGEVFVDQVDVALLARYTRRARLPTVLDFSFAAAVRETVAGHAGTELLARLYEDDVLYEGGADAALKLPTFISNHDMGRFAHQVYKRRPDISDNEALQRVALAHVMLLTLRGVPTLYAGDEQGFVGIGGDQSARQDMFPSRVAEYNEARLLGTQATTADSNFDLQHPLYRLIAQLSRLKAEHPALRRGRQQPRNYTRSPGLFAVSRFDPDSGREYMIAFNTSNEALTAQVEIEAASSDFLALHGNCQPTPTAPGSLRVSLPPLGFVICVARAVP